MNLLTTRALFVLVLTLPSCGQQLVEFVDPKPDSGLVQRDAGAITSTDTRAGSDTQATTSTDTRADSDAQATPSTDTRDVDANVDLSDAELTLPLDPDAGDAEESSADAGDTDASNVDSGDADAGVAPTVTLTNPLDDAVDVSITKQLEATFSEPMNDATVSTLTFIVADTAGPVSGTVTYDNNTLVATFVPDADLELDTLYTATITLGAEDLAGTTLGQDRSWSFRTSACALSLVDLTTAGNFAVLAATGVTNTGASSVTGALGVSPGTAITGFPPGMVNGTIHSNDATSGQGASDLTTAYNDAAGRTLCTVTVSGNLGGQTLTPGLYTSTSSLEISSGDLTLDAQGDEDAVFIFQTASTLTTTAGLQVILSGGAEASHVFWQVGSSATLGTGSVFQGTIMADTAVTLTTGATLNGRALARTAAVTLDSNTVIVPAL